MRGGCRIKRIKGTLHRPLLIYGIGLEKDFKEEFAMQTYLIMGKFTEKGITNIKETTQRADNFKEISADTRHFQVNRREIDCN